MRIAIADDSPLAVQAMARVIRGVPGLQLAWIAGNGREAVRQCAEDRPDLLLMDLVMPEMNGVEATRAIMASTPCAVLIVTATVEANFAMVFDALGAGALDVVKTPVLGPEGHGPGEAALLAKIDLLRRLVRGRAQPSTPPPPAAVAEPEADSPLVVIGASAGGPAALAAVLGRLPRDFPAPVVLVQHLDVQFAALLAQWLHEQSTLPVRAARAGDVPLPGQALLAATDDHLILTGRRRLEYTSEPLDTFYRPSVDVFFESVARHWRGPLVAVLLTGMGRDGAKGLKRLRGAGALTIAQDRASCVVYGMPKAAAELDAASEILPLEEIAPRLVQHFAVSA